MVCIDRTVTVRTAMRTAMSSNVMFCAVIGGSLIERLANKTDTGSVDPYTIKVLNSRTIWD